MNNDTDELDLTAFALGELEGAQRAEVESLIARDKAARTHVEAMRATAELVAAGLAREASEAAPGDYRLTELQLAAIERRLAGDREPARDFVPLRLRHNWALWGSLAASVAIVCTVTATVVVPLLRAANGKSGAGIFGTTGTPSNTDNSTGVGPIIIEPDRPFLGTPSDPNELPPAVETPVPGSMQASTPGEGGFVRAADRPVSAFPPSPVYPGDVEKGSFGLARRSLETGVLPTPGAVRTDAFVNAFAYHYPAPQAGDAIGMSVEVAGCPWEPAHRLVRIGLRTMDRAAAGPAGAALNAAALDVSVRVEFNPAVASAYRLIGYEGRPSGAAVNDPSDPAAIDALAVGQTVTALYEVVPFGQPDARATTRPAPSLKYQTVTLTPTGGSELLTATVTFRDPDSRQTRSIETAVTDAGRSFDAASDDFRTAAAAAELGMLLRQASQAGNASFDTVIDLAGRVAAGSDAADRKVLADLAARAKALTTPTARPR